ncbi:MAG: ATP-dependent helicase UvrD/PcrA [Tepidanaerobacteraceae bacterium]|nr:ATP-dependent helicase UvrD/PcrA [Tepidanaerobacteraceae bacterium]
MDFLKDLNPEQKRAVMHPGGPLLILAGAGSGKTRVLTYRTAYLIKYMGVKPENILAITFTNKAAREMRMRIEKMLPWVRGILVSTFHSACVRFLRSDIDKLGYKSNFIIFDTQDQQVLMRECIKTKNIDEKKYTPSGVLSYISRAKENLLSPAKCLEKAKDIREKTMASLYEMYQQKLRENNAMDFDDLIMNTVELFRRNVDVLSFYQKKFQHILVDEYQDTNRAQYELVKLMAQVHRNLCVVGDDDQSIYGFRGADIRNILDFEEDFPDATVIRLEQNYRSTANILDAANSVIDHNLGRKKKKLWTKNETGDKIRLATLADEHEEAFFIAREIERLIQEMGMNLGDFAVLYRTNAQSRILEETMLKMGLPYKMVGGIRFYQRKEIKDLLAYLRVAMNPSDDVSLTRIINVPRRGIGEATVNNLRAISDTEGVSIYEILKRIDEFPFASATRKKLIKFGELVEELIKRSKAMSIPEFMSFVLEETGYMEDLEAENTPDSQSRMENLKEMIGAAREFEKRMPEGGLEDFLAEAALLSEVDELSEGEQAVVLMTLHSAKGLEFPVVFLAGMDEGIFPHARSMINEDELEEERRLCYVGITRAKKLLYLTRAWQRNLYGNASYYTSSRFIDEIPSDLLEEVASEDDGLLYKVAAAKDRLCPSKNQFPSPASYATTSRSTSLSGSHAGLAPGDRVKHSKWGEGIVVSLDGMDEDAEISIDFSSVGLKHLMLKYAPIIKL